MSEGLLLGIDEGTTAVKAVLFDTDLRPVASARRGLETAHPRAGWVEQDPELVLAAVIEAVAEVLQRREGRPVSAAGLDHQGESVLAWDARSGEPLTPVIVWQDKRQLHLLESIAEGVRERSGLPLDPYFSAGKLAWLMRHEQALAPVAAAGRLRLGTVDAFLRDRLGAGHATDLSTASRTQLLALGGEDWDEALLDAFGLRREWLPTIGPSFGALGELTSASWPIPLALHADLVDQQAALAGSGAIADGELKATYGTGVFVLGRCGPHTTAGGLLPTVAWAAGDRDGGIGEVAHALDGGVFAAGSLLDWMAGGLGLAEDAAALAAAAATVPDCAGVLILPALAGLGAPWWRPHAHGVIAGLHGGVEPSHLARAALSAIAWRVADIVAAMATEAPVRTLRVDGGLTRDETLLQLQADALGLALLVGETEVTALGAAMLAGVGAGVFASVEEAARRLPPGRIVEPSPHADERHAEHERWRAFVKDSAGL